MAQLLDERDLGVLTSSMSLLVALVSNHHEAYWSCLPKCVKTLERLARNQDIPQEYTYYGIPSPWLQVCISFPIFQHIGMQQIPYFKHGWHSLHWFSKYSRYLMVLLFCVLPKENDCNMILVTCTLFKKVLPGGNIHRSLLGLGAIFQH